MQILKKLDQIESLGGILLLAAATIAIIIDNSPLGFLYEHLLATKLAIHIGALHLSKPLYLWINDGLMAIFFLLVGLEIKREVCFGVLNTPSKIIFPAVVALGGLIVPVLIYWWFNTGNTVGMQGWAIPAATDIAFSLGILSLLGRRAPLWLKIFFSNLNSLYLMRL